LCLLSNAVKFGMDVAVVVRCYKFGPDKLMFEVEDDGVGVPEENRALLFQPFQQQAQRIEGGTGLGLYSLSKRVECMKGQCGIRNRNDDKRGCCFWFSIPYVPDDAVDVEQVPAASSLALKKMDTFGSAKVHPLAPTSPRAAFYSAPNDSHSTDNNLSCDEETPRPCRSSIVENSQASILLVDDAIVIQKTIGGSLRRRNFDVAVASNGLIGLNMMKEKRYDVVLMDLQMPIMDGHESVKRLRAFEKETNVPFDKRQIVIAISANSDKDTISQTSASGMDNFLPKPFSIDNLLKICEDLNEDLSSSKKTRLVSGDGGGDRCDGLQRMKVLSDKYLKEAYVITPY